MNTPRIPDPNYRKSPDAWIRQNPVTFLAIIALSLVILYFSFALLFGGCAVVATSAAVGTAAEAGSSALHDIFKQNPTTVQAPFPGNMTAPPANGLYGTPSQISPPVSGTVQPPQQQPAPNQQGDALSGQQPDQGNTQQQNQNEATPQPLIP